MSADQLGVVEETGVAKDRDALVQAAPPMLAPRVSPATFQLDANRILVAGGVSGLSPVGTPALEVYDAANNSWSAVTAVPSYNAGARLSDGTVLINFVERVNAMTTKYGAFRRLTSPTTAMMVPDLPTTTTINAIYTRVAAIPGGDALVVATNTARQSLAFRYLAATNSWLTLSDPQRPSLFRICDFGDGRLLLDRDEWNLSSAFDAATNTFTPLPSWDQFFQSPFCVDATLPDGRQLSFIGSQKIWQRNGPGTIWSEVGLRPSPSPSDGAAALLADRRHIAFFGGRIGSQAHDRVDVFDTSTKLWLQPEFLSVPRAAMGTATLPDGRLMLLGGWYGPYANQVTNMVEFFTGPVVCQPQTTCGNQCGPIPDGCGGTLQCARCVVAETATYSSTLKAPACTVRSTSCSTAQLVAGRGTVGPELNAPNTIAGSCADGSVGKFHSDESVDAIRVASVGGEPIAELKSVSIEVDVWAWTGYTSDKLDIFIAANASAPTWVRLATLTPTKAGANTLRTTATVPVSASGTVAVRAQFRYGGLNASACASGSYNDRDDLAFVVR